MSEAESELAVKVLLREAYTVTSCYLNHFNTTDAQTRDRIAQ